MMYAAVGLWAVVGLLLVVALRYRLKARRFRAGFWRNRALVVQDRWLITASVFAVAAFAAFVLAVMGA